MGIIAAIKGSKVWLYLAFAAAFLWGLLLLVGKLMSAGAAKERDKAQGQIIKDVETRHEIDRAVAGDPDPADSLHKRWSRD